MILGFKEQICAKYPHQVVEVICLTPLNGAQLWMQTVGGSAHNKVYSLFLFKKHLGTQTDCILPQLGDLQALVLSGLSKFLLSGKED